MADSHSSGDYSDVVSRRKFVSLAGTTGAAAVAGCLGDGGGGDDDDDDSGDSGTGDPGMGETGSAESTGTSGDGGDGVNYPDANIWFETAGTSFSVDQMQYNSHQGWFIPHGQFGTYAPWARYLNVLDEFHPYLMTDWEHTDNNEFVLTMSEDFVWGESGDSITAEDMVFQLEVYEQVGSSLFSFIDSYEASGEYELTLSYSENTREDFVTYSALQMVADSPESRFGDAMESDEPGIAGISIDVPDPSGPLAVTNRTANFHQYEPRDGLDDWADDPVAGDHFNWNGYRLEYRSSNNATHQSFIASELDGIHSLFVSPDTLDDFPDSVEQFQIPGNFGCAIWPDHSDEPFSIREVRQALYYSLDREATIENVGASTKVSHHPAPTGLTWASLEATLGSTEPEGFTVYSFDQDEAESLLSEAGYSPGDISASLAYPQSWSDWAVAAQSTIDQLTAVGWDISGDARSGGPGGYADSLGEGIDLAIDQHTPGGDASQNLPYFGLEYILRNQSGTWRNPETHFANYNTSLDPITLPDGTEVDIDQTLEDLAVAAPDEREALIRDLALVVNKDVPVVYLMEKYEQSFIDTERFDIPESSDHFNAFWPLWWLPQVDESLESAGPEDTPGLMKANPPN